MDSSSCTSLEGNGNVLGLARSSGSLLHQPAQGHLHCTIPTQGTATPSTVRTDANEALRAFFNEFKLDIPL